MGIINSIVNTIKDGINNVDEKIHYTECKDDKNMLACMFNDTYREGGDLTDLANEVRMSSPRTLEDYTDQILTKNAR